MDERKRHIHFLMRVPFPPTSTLRAWIHCSFFGRAKQRSHSTPWITCFRARALELPLAVRGACRQLLDVVGDEVSSIAGRLLFFHLEMLTNRDEEYTSNCHCHLRAARARVLTRFGAISRRRRFARLHGRRMHPFMFVETRACGTRRCVPSQRCSERLRLITVYHMRRALSVRSSSSCIDLTWPSARQGAR